MAFAPLTGKLQGSEARGRASNAKNSRAQPSHRCRKGKQARVAVKGKSETYCALAGQAPPLAMNSAAVTACVPSKSMTQLPLKSAPLERRL